MLLVSVESCRDSLCLKAAMGVDNFTFSLSLFASSREGCGGEGCVNVCVFALFIQTVGCWFQCMLPFPLTSAFEVFGISLWSGPSMLQLLGVH